VSLKKVAPCSHLLLLVVQLAIIAAVLVQFSHAQDSVGLWKFDEGSGTAAFSSSGDGQPAMLSSGLHWIHDSHGWMISANAGNKDFVTVPPVDLTSTHAVTVSLWVNRAYSTDNSGNDGALVESGGVNQDSTSGFAILPDDPTCRGIRAWLRGNEGTTENCYTQPTSDTWHHLAVVYDKRLTGGDQVEFYIDGVRQNPTWSVAAATSTDAFGKDPIYLFSHSGGSRFSSGKLRNFAIYNTALSGRQIQQIYNGSNPAIQTQPISYVQGNYATPQSPQTTVSVTYSSAQTAGDLNVVVVGWNDSNATVTRVADSKGNTYTRAVGPTVQSGVASQSIYYAKNIATASARTNTVTVTFSTAAAYPDIRILEYSGADPSNPIDVTSANSGSGSSCNSGSATTTNPTDLVLGANIVQTMTGSPGSGYTKRLLTQPDGDIAEDQMTTTAGSYSATASMNPSAQWIMQMVAFRTPAGSGGFSMSASPSSLTITPGTYGTSTITTTTTGSFNSSISLSATGVPSGTTVNFNPTTIPAPGSGSSTMTITVGTSTAAGTYPITVAGNGGGTQQNTTVTITVTAPGFTVSASPGSLSIGPGNQGTSAITTSVSGGFNSAISLSATGAPSGTTVSFNPSSIPAPGSGSSTMTLVVGSSTAPGTYPITVKGTGGGIQQTTTVTLTVTAPTFALSASPSSLSIAPGHQGSSTVTTSISGGFNSAISLSATGAPSGTTVSFNPVTIPAPGSGSSTMTITVGSGTAPGTYPITVAGSGGGIQRTTTLTLTVTGLPDFTISASPNSLTVQQGSPGTSTITTALLNGFNSSIALSASGMPSGTTVSFNPLTIPAPGSGTSAMTITVGSGTAIGTYTLTVSGNGGGVQHTATISLTVTTFSSASPTLVQHVTCPNSEGIGSGSGGYENPTPSYVCPLAEPAQAGNTLVLGFFSDDASNPTWTISDDKNNTWRLATSTTDNNGNIIAVYYALNVAAGTRMITVKNSGGTNGYLEVSESEYYNVASSSAFDAASCNAGSGSTSITAGNITPTVSGDLLWQYGANAAAASVSSFAAGSQSNITWSLNGTDILTGDATQAGIYNSISTINPTFSSGTSQAWDSCAVALKAASAGTVPTQSFRILHMLHAQLPADGSSPFKVQVPTSGNLLVVSFISGGTLISSISSSPANTWSATGSADVYGQTASQIYYAPNASTSNTMNITFNLIDGISGSTFMIYDIAGAATAPFDVDSGGQYGNQTSIVNTLTTCTNCLTPSGPNELIVGNFGQEWCTATAVNVPNGALFDAATYNGNSISGPEQVDQNNGWLHYYDSGAGPLSATWTESCGTDAEAHWSGRLAAFKRAQ
jgi:uncharacterized membrane protein